MTDEIGTISYRELHDRSLGVAEALEARGLSAGATVLLKTGRNANAVAAMLGAVAAGVAYAPVDPDEPEMRFARIVAGSCARYAVVDGEGGSEVGAVDIVPVNVDTATGHETIVAPAGDAITYVMFTSGSTGIPKGVEVTQKNLEAFLDGARTWSGTAPSDIWASFHAFTFDISMWEVWGSLTSGGHLVLMPKTAQRDVHELIDLLDRFGVMHLCQTPTAVRRLAAHMTPESLASLRTLFICGERLDFRSLRCFEPRVRSGSLEIWNLYGPTEATIYASGRRVSSDEILREARSFIGRPLPHVDIRLDDETNDEGGAEILIGGPGVAAGYRGDCELTRDRFLERADGRFYRTGDLGRWVDGELEFIGRAGGFIKMRGYRIEPDEIVTALLDHPGLEEAAVVVSEVVPGGEALVAAVVGRDPELTDAGLRRFLAARLPQYMRPTRIVFVEQLPRLPSAKLDRGELHRIISQQLSGASKVGVAAVAYRNPVSS